MTRKVDPGHFAVMIKKTKTKEDIERLWVSKVTKGHLISYWIIEENPNKEYTIKLYNLQEEVPSRAKHAVPQLICNQPENQNHI